MMKLLIVDTETTGLEEHDRIIEIGAVVFDTNSRCMVECFSSVLQANENPAQAINGIPVSVLDGRASLPAWSSLANMAAYCDAFVAHNAAFDMSFVRRENADVASMLPWICTLEDFVWPKESHGKSLINIALAHSIAVTSAHRAIHDCFLMARLFEVIEDIDARMFAALEHAKMQKFQYASLAPFEEKDTVKAHGFHWYPDRRQWMRTMAEIDAESLPFRVKKVAP